MPGIGAAAASGAAGAGVGGVFGIINNAIAHHYAEEDRQANYEYNELAADNADRRQRAQFNDLYSIQAQLKQIEEAGLSPSMMFGGVPSQGGATAPQGAGTAGRQTQTYPIDPIAGAQLALTMAQAKKANAEADTLNGNNERGSAEIAKVLAEAGAYKASTLYTQSQTIFQEIQNKIAGATEQAQIDKIIADAETAGEKALQAVIETQQKGINLQFDRATYNTRVEQQTAQLANMCVDTMLKQSNIAVNDELKAKLVEEAKLMVAQAAKVYEEKNFISKNYELQKRFIKEKIGQGWQTLENQLKIAGIQTDNNTKTTWIRGALGIVSSGVGAAAMYAMKKFTEPKVPMVAPIYMPQQPWQTGASDFY